MRNVTVLALRLPARVITLALVARLVDEWWSYLPAGAIDGLRTDLGIDYGAAGWLLACLWLGGLVGAPLASLTDHVPRRPLAVLGAAGLSVGLLAYAAAAPFSVLVGASLLLGLSSDLVLRPLEAALVELEPARLDRLLGVQHVLSWAGDLAGPLLLAAGAATALGWQGAFGVTAGVTAVYAAVLAATPFPAPPSAKLGARAAARDFADLFRRREVLVLAALEAVLMTLDEPFFGFAVARLGAEGLGGWSQVLALGSFVGGVLGSGIVARRGIGRRARRLGPAVLLAGTLVVAAGPALAVQIAGMAAVSGGTALVWAVLHHRTLTVVPGRSASVSAAVGTLATSGLLGPVAMGALADATNVTVALVAGSGAALAVVALVPLTGSARVPAEADA